VVSRQQFIKYPGNEKIVTVGEIFKAGER
jgi:hypothetical protein